LNNHIIFFHQGKDDVKIAAKIIDAERISITLE